MKSIIFYLMNLTVLFMLVACGKDNESGKKNTYASTSPYGYNSPYSTGNFSPIVSSGYNAIVDQVLAQTLCWTSGAPNQNRMRFEFPLTNFPSVVPAGNIYVGVTTVGDVAMLVGQGTNAPLFVTFMCQRYYTSGQGQLVELATGSTSRCAVSPLAKATMIIPGNAQAISFRMLDAGRLNQAGQLVPYAPPVCM
jgi:hypothetical protein